MVPRTCPLTHFNWVCDVSTVFTNYYNHTCCFYTIVMSPQAALACCRALARSWLTRSMGVPFFLHVRTDWPRSKNFGLTPTWLTTSSGNHHQWKSTRLSEMQGKRKPVCRIDEISEMSDFGEITIFLLKKDMAIFSISGSDIVIWSLCFLRV